MGFKQNKAQEEAIKTINGRVMIVSCPGSGKTTTLIRRIHHMIEEGVKPSTILMVTFSRAAALEMKEKYEKFFGNNPGISFQTIHSLCFNLLIREGKYTRGDVLQENDKMDYLISIMKEYPEADDCVELAKCAATNITSVKNNYIDLSEYEPEGIDGMTFRDVFRRYEKWKKDIRKIDFDDMLVLCKDMFEKDKKALDRWASHFCYIQCDEYQDTNMIQRDILYMLSQKHGNLCVVGDDDQSIYRFRGARPEIMLHFMDDFPDAKKIMMGTNYRSAGEIVEKAGKLILKNKIRYGKTFESQRGKDGVKGETEYVRCETKQDEMDWMVKKIQDLHNDCDYKDMAVLFRTNQQAVLPVSTLSNAGIPFFCVDSVQCIYDGWIFRGIKTYIDLACGNYEDDADMHKKVQSVLNKPNRFLNPDWFTNVEFSPSGFHKAIYPLSKDAFWKYEQALEHVDTWLRLLGPGKLSMEDAPDVALKRLEGANGVRYDRHINDMAKLRHQDPETFFEELDELKKEAAKYDTIREWFAHAEWMSRFIREESKKKNPEGVVLATMHKSKGLEWKNVFIIDCNDGTIPHKNSIENEQIEEERRLFYVAMTRAKDVLYVINSNKNQSQFIKEASLYTAEEKKQKEEIPKYLPGKKVFHKSFGEGKLLSYGPNTISISFKCGVKMFQFPQSFKDGYLKYV